MKTPTSALTGLGLALGLLAGAPWTASAHGAARHHVSIRWEVAYSDLHPSRADMIDGFISTGPPFGHARVQTRTPRDQSSEPIRTPRFEGRNRRGRFRGRLRVEKTYLETTATHQLAKFEGTGSFDGGSGRYRNATGRITRLAGKVDCFADGTCDGHLKLSGWVRF